ncbi:MAG: helix-turn-helix transcriptional regulator [[Clostridium] aminophilum]|uniref:helix-turn-helix domain-containing protein n=1 Tax=[Clostridium] aminophilum TaxID=1526 RepID=UPI0026ED924D|nr:helix-turn-helix transcriptional regulator [[Clostridium] aminophilum]MDD6196569.1 helix-turn-helix transcriptional regulator [[Clostridium] aminophilum]
MFNKNEFKAAIARAGMTSRELAEKIGINESTLYRKINSNGAFNREEINTIIEVLHIEDPKEIFFA